MSILWRDLRIAVRTLRQSPGFFLTAVLALVLGIGPNTAIFSLVYATLLAPLPYDEPEQLVMVWSQVRGGRNAVSPGDYLTFKAEATTFEYLDLFAPRDFNLSTAGASTGEAERVRVRQVSPGGHRLFREPMFLGRDFEPGDDQPGRDQVVLITHRLWTQRFSADPGIIGREIRLDSTPCTIIGVLPPGTADRLPAQMWKPLSLSPAQQNNHDVRSLLLMGRIKSGVTLQQAQQEMSSIATGLAQRFPNSNTGWSVSVEPLQNNFMGAAIRTNLWLLLASVSFVVLIACVNVANLLLARGTARQREIALRAALGATRGQLFRQVLTESLVLSVCGGALGILSSVWILRGVLAILPPFTLPSEADPRLDLPVLLFTSGIAMISGLLFGVAPAWQAMRVDLHETLKQSGRTAVGGGRRALRHGLVLVEFALAVTLLAAAGLTIHSFWNRTQVDLGVQTDRLLTFSLPVEPGRLTTPTQMDVFYRDLLERMRSVPGVTNAAVSTGLPFVRLGMPVRFEVVGQAQDGPVSSRPGAAFQASTPDYFATFGIRLRQGRFFTDQDTAGAMRVAVVNERFVDRFLKGLDPLQQRLEVTQMMAGVPRASAPLVWQIVGVFKNVANGQQFGDPEQPEIYVPFSQSPAPQVLAVVRTTADPATVQRGVVTTVRAMDSALPVANVKTMEQIVSERLAFDRLYVALYGALAGVALLLAGLGIYGVMAFMVAQRTPEIGLRMALGAGRGQVLAQVLREGVRLAIGGLVLGLAGAYAAGRAMQTMLYGTGAMNAAVLLPVAVVLIAAALAACYIPARRASVIDPMIALRQ